MADEPSTEADDRDDDVESPAPTDESAAPSEQAEVAKAAAAPDDPDDPDGDDEEDDDEVPVGTASSPAPAGKKRGEPAATAPATTKKRGPVDDSPEGKKLHEAEIAFEVGDFKRTRELASALASSSRAPIRDAANDLLRRTDVDPLQMVFLALCLCGILGVAYYYLG